MAELAQNSQARTVRPAGFFVSDFHASQRVSTPPQVLILYCELSQSRLAYRDRLAQAFAKSDGRITRKQ